MKRLLSANFSRLFKSLWFWLCGAGMLGYSLWQAAGLLSWAVDGPWAGRRGDFVSSRVCDFTVPMLLIMPVLCTLFLNADYHDGTIRNKLVVGYRRRQVYLADFLTVLAAALIYAAAHVLVMLAAGLFIKEQAWESCPWAADLLYSLPYILSVTALFTLLGMLVRLRAVPVIAILLAVAMLWLPQYLHEQLSYPEETVLLDGILMTELPDGEGGFRTAYWRDGEEISEDELEMAPSPAYVEEPRRSVYYFLLETLPGGQAYCLSESLPLERHSIVELALWSLALAGLATGAGLLMFRRADIK